MELYELYRLINLQMEMIQELKVVGGQLNINQFDLYLEKLMDRNTAAQAYRDLKVLLAEDKDNIKMLYCQLECARRIFDKYQAKHISNAVYIDTMQCFTRFIEECKRKNGRMFFDRGWWTYRQVSMCIFRIGQLEYEFNKHEGENAIAIHIPSDVNLTKGAVDHSLEQAGIFFQTYYKDYEYKGYTCDSWLLSPVLRSLLPEKSNILSFQKRFDIIQENKEDREYIEWLFQVPADTDYEALPVETGLQRNVRELLLNGGAVGCAYGVMKGYS